MSEEVEITKNVPIFVFHSKSVSGIEFDEKENIIYIDTDPYYEQIKPENRTFYFKELLFNGIHDEDYTTFVREASEKAKRENISIVPTVFPTFSSNLTKPESIEDKAGWYMFDTTIIDSNTYLNATRVVFGSTYVLQQFLNTPANIVLLSSSPGQFAGRNKGGKGCIFNSTANIAKNIVIKNIKFKVVILDLTKSYSHGLQDIFSDSIKVFILSLHQKETNLFFSGDFHERGPNKNFINLPYNARDATIDDLKTLIKFGFWNIKTDISTFFVIMIDSDTSPELGTYVKEFIGPRKKILIVEGNHNNYSSFANNLFG